MYKSRWDVHNGVLGEYPARRGRLSKKRGRSRRDDESMLGEETASVRRVERGWNWGEAVLESTRSSTRRTRQGSTRQVRPTSSNAS